MAQGTETTGTFEPQARERILDTAYELFSHRGVRAVGVDEVISSAGVAKATLYRHFPSKDELVLAFLERREQRWTHEWLSRRRQSDGATRRRNRCSRSSTSSANGSGATTSRRARSSTCCSRWAPSTPLGKASVGHLENIRSIVRGLAEEAGLRDPESFARSCHILMKGSIVSAAEGDVEAAQRGKSMARLLIEQHRT